MNITYRKYLYPITLAAVVIIFIFGSIPLLAARKAWKREEVDLRMSGGSKIKALIYPQDKPVPLRKREVKRKKVYKEKIQPDLLAQLEERVEQPIFANVVNSPPIDGFVPLVAVSITDARADELDANFVAVPSDTIEGSFLTANPDEDYAIGIFDTGASAHLMGNQAAVNAGIFAAGLNTGNITEIGGVTGTVDAWVSEPLGFYIDGLSAIEPDGTLQDTSGMVGEWNVSIAMGQGGEPDLPTAVGSPLSVYYATEISVDDIINVTKDSEDFNSPDLTFYNFGDPCIPSYSNIIPLELRPLGGVNVQYLPNVDGFTLEPLSPSIIVGNLSQSLFFVHSVDLYDEGEEALDKDRFMLDTGAQVTVMSNRIASRLRINPDYPDFQVEIIDVTGTVEIVNGYYLDQIEIPAFGEWLIAINVPVILLDVASPEGGTLDGIIGMNLFTEFNLVLHGGGLLLQDNPYLAYEAISRIIADIAPEGGDGVVDNLDLEAFVAAWLSTGNTIPPSPNWNPLCDMAPQPEGDGDVNLPDYAVFAEHWYESIE